MNDLWSNTSRADVESWSVRTLGKSRGWPREIEPALYDNQEVRGHPGKMKAPRVAPAPSVDDMPRTRPTGIEQGFPGDYGWCLPEGSLDCFKA